MSWRTASTRVRLSLIALERRLTPNNYVVSSAADSGAGTLRQAILDANANTGPDAITFDATVFAAHQTISLTSGTPSITGAVTITGPSVGVTVKNTVANAHVIDVYKAPTGTNVTFQNLTITGGGALSGLTAGVYATGQNVTLM